MKIQVGIDLCEIERIEKALEKNPLFARRVLGDRERAYYEEHGMKAESIAAAFSAKEAFAKAMGTGIRDFAMREVEVLHDELGKPYYAFTGKAAELVEAQGLTFELSLTHSRSDAAAVAVGYRED